MQQITELLQNHSSKDGVSLQEHLQNIIQKYVNNDNYTENDKHFELLSNFVKKNKYVYKDPKSDKEVNNIPIVHNELYEWAQKNLQLIKEYNKLKRQKDQNILFPNFINDSQMLQQAGIYFGEEECYRIAMSLRKLQQQTQATQLRFWGKILTRGQDYYIAEGQISNKYSDQVPFDAEAIGTGANTYTYWVSHNVLDEWFELPYVTPQQITAAQQIKYIFTGDLSKAIKTYPPFPGQEKHFLRAQIARISSSTVLIPKDLYTYEEEEKKLVYGEEPFKLPEYGDLKTLDAWQLLQQGLYSHGRCAHWVDPNLPEEKREEKLAELQEKEPDFERLRGITEEKSPYPPANEDDENPNWLIREYGDLQQYNLVGKDDGNVGCYGTISLKNLTWPGAQLICNSKTWVNIYVGYGLQVGQNAFNPIQPPEILNEGEDIEEHPEPNPNKPIEIIEPDSDNEGKEGEEGEEDE